jgi:lysine 2,3-aminomutase
MTWKEQLKAATQTEDIRKWLEQCGRSFIPAVAQNYPVVVTPHYRSLIDDQNSDDPLLRIVAPTAAELSGGGLADTMGEHLDYKVQGLQHRYPATALLVVNDFCASYCRFCFRKRLFTPDLIEKETVEDLDAAVAYIKAHGEINNVLLSGGDPLVSATNRLRRILNRLAEIPHVQAVRIGTKVPAFLPHRLLEDGDLLDVLEEFNARKPLYIVAHFDHANEIASLAREAVDGLLRRGVPVLSHAVLLKGVNDTAETLRSLFAAMAQARIEPYYLFHSMPVVGGQHFQIPLETGWNIVANAQRPMSGLQKRYRYILPHLTGKLEFLGLDREHYFVRYHEARDPSMVSRIAKIARTAGDYWFEAKDISLI